ncbi:unnamed protein product [Pedinophyceae sp. YPF-701]|nr:unnamed protein product [Pedinophyceae sp. YPF-701]
MAAEDGPPTAPARFHAVPPGPPSKPDAWDEAYLKGNLSKWDLKSGLRVRRYRYERAYHKMAADEFLTDLLNDPGFQSTFQVVDKAGKEQPFPHGPVTGIRATALAATETSMSFFDRLEDCDPAIVGHSGTIARCIEDVVDGQNVHNMLQEALTREGDSEEHPDLFTPDERKQLLYRVFRLMVLGGACNQYEDTLEPYLESTKRLYKGLLAVRKAPATPGGVEVVSGAYELLSVGSAGADGSAFRLFPRAHPNNAFMVVADPVRKVATVIYHAVGSAW